MTQRVRKSKPALWISGLETGLTSAPDDGRRGMDASASASDDPLCLFDMTTVLVPIVRGGGGGSSGGSGAVTAAHSKSSSVPPLLAPLSPPATYVGIGGRPGLNVSFADKPMLPATIMGDGVLMSTIRLSGDPRPSADEEDEEVEDMGVLAEDEVQVGLNLSAGQE